MTIAFTEWGAESPFGSEQAGAASERSAGSDGADQEAGLPQNGIQQPEWLEPYETESLVSQGGFESETFPFPSGAVLQPASGPVGHDEEHWDPNPHPNGATLPLLDTSPQHQGVKLSAHFTVKELVTSGGHAAPVARISPELVRTLEAIRMRAGRGVHITSGYRSWARNKAVYHARGEQPTKSRHCSGEAADIAVTGLSGVQLAKLAIDAAGGELAIGIGRDFIHVDVRGTWTLWTYLTGAQGAQARSEVQHYRDHPGPVAPAALPPVVPSPAGTTAGGRLEVARYSLVHAHHGSSPDLVLRWNAMTTPDVVDVVVHFHGFSGSKTRMTLPRDKEPRSGLDFFDPTHFAAGGRTAPTLALLPRGNYYGGRSGAGYNFPELMKPGAMKTLIEDGLRLFGERTGIAARRGRLILTGHSGGGAPLTAVLSQIDPDEIELFDALYGAGTAVSAWAHRRIAAELASPAALPPSMRVLYIPGTGTQANSLEVARSLEASLRLPGADRLAARFRVQATRVAHDEIPRRFGWRLLADAGADLPDTSLAGRAAHEYLDESDFAVAEDTESEGAVASGWALEEFEHTGESGQTRESEQTGESEQSEGSDPPAYEEWETFDQVGETEYDYASERETEGWEAEEFEEDWESREGEAEADEHPAVVHPLAESEGFPLGAVLNATSGLTGDDEEHFDPNGVNLPLLDTGLSVQGTKLSEHFTVRELVSSGGRVSPIARISPQLVRVLEAIRMRAGRPVRITSGYRSWARNKAVYQRRNQRPTLSRHCSGQAADITIAGMSGVALAKLAIDAAGKGLAIGVGPDYIHVDVRGSWTVWTYFSGARNTQVKREIQRYRDHAGTAPDGLPALGPTPALEPAAGGRLSARDFVARYAPFARASEAATGVPALVTLAQAALESGWGGHAPQFNFFGIKAKASDPPETRQLLRTREVFATADRTGFPEIISVTPRADGKFDYVVRDWFRSYPGAGAAFLAHGQFLVKNKRYAAAVQTVDPYAFAAAVAKAGYATDPSYEHVLAGVMKTVESSGF
jgi:uncharacterized protein YcbK (DUF882 family)